MTLTLLNWQPDLNPSMMHCKACDYLDDPIVYYVDRDHPIRGSGLKYHPHLDIRCRRCGYTVEIKTLGEAGQ